MPPADPYIELVFDNYGIREARGSEDSLVAAPPTFSMEAQVMRDAVYAPSEDVVVREIEDKIIIVPLVSGGAAGDGEVFTLNSTGRAILQQLDGRRTLKEVATSLAREFAVPPADLENDVLKFANVLEQRGIIVALKHALPK
jgi:hypothetical protein